MKIIQAIIERVLIDSITKWRVKLLLFLSASLISVAVILYARYLANELIEREVKIIKFYTDIFRRYANLTDNLDDRQPDYDFLIFEVAPTISFPMIMTDAEDQPLFSVDEFTNDTIFTTYTLNVKLNPKQSAFQQKIYLESMIKKMKAEYKPIIIKLEEQDIILQKFYYTHSSAVDYLRYFPLVTIIVMTFFIFVGYLAFNFFRRNEESKVWVGMSKEAAHQLGTPLSSLLAWIEIIRLNRENPNMIDDTLSEMQNDIDRLNKITIRFSKIGSMPVKKQEDLSIIIENVSQYFERRLPNLGKKVEIIRNIEKGIIISVNQDLMEWVFENLLKNAAESIEEKQGRIEIQLVNLHNKKIVITVKDNGKGMNTRTKRNAFNPGFTTKKRGWGLGLSLTRRIIEDYHSGKIFIKESILGKGTVFQIEIPFDINK